MSTPTKLLTLAAAAGLVAAAATSGPASAAPRKHTRTSWAPAATATVHPGVQTYTDGAQCTANFVYTDGTSVYLGQAAHCSSTGAANDTNGCTTKTLPEGTPVEVTGASKPGIMVYNSWARMQRAREKNADTC